MASQGPNYGGSITTAAVGSENAEDWVNPSNAGADDGSEASITAATFDSPDVSYWLWATNFGFSVPAGATINGLQVEIKRRCSAGAAVDNRVSFYDTSVGNTNLSDNKFSGTAWPASSTVATYGGPTDTWNIAGIDATFVNQADFGLVLSVKANAADTDVHVDYMRVTVFYTETASDRFAQVAWVELEIPDESAEAPAATFTHSANGQTLAFTDTSTDGDGTIVTWAWTFGDTQSSSSQNPTHHYDQSGTYTVTLTVTDSQGLQDTESKQIEVGPDPEIVVPVQGWGLGCRNMRIRIEWAEPGTVRDFQIPEGE